MSELSKFVLLTNKAIVDGLRVGELRGELTKRGLSISGLKADLKERLKKAMVDKVPICDFEKIIFWTNWI